MKKLLIASTALVVSAGFAAADVAVTGSASMGVKLNDGDMSMHNEIDFNIVGSGTTDGGLTFGASLDVDGESHAVTTTGTVSDAEVYISGAFGTLTVGNISNGADIGGISDLGFDDIGVDDAGEAGRLEGAYDTHFKTTFADFTVTLSLDSEGGGDYGLGVAYAAGDFTVALGTSRDDSAGDTASHITAGGTFGDVAAKVTYTSAADGTTGTGIQLGYTIGAIDTTVVWSDNTTAGQEASYGVGFAYDLGGGAALKGAIGSIHDGTSRASVADLGVTMSF